MIDFLTVIPFAYTIRRYYYNYKSFLKYLLTEFLLLFLLPEFNLSNFLIFYTFYELGYIDNDYFSERKNEVNKIRDSLNFSKVKINRIYITKIIIAFIIMIFIKNELKFLYIIILLLFYIFNRTSNQYSRLLIFSTIAYMKFVIISFPNSIFNLLIISLAISPFIFHKTYKYINEKKINKTFFFILELGILSIISYYSFKHIEYNIIAKNILIGLIPLFTWIFIDYAKNKFIRNN